MEVTAPTIRRIAAVLVYVCVILALPLLARGAGALWRDLDTAAPGIAAATGTGLATMLSRLSEPDLLLPVALAGATAGLGAILWLMVIPLIREHAQPGTGPGSDRPLATVTPIRTERGPVEDPGRRRAA